MSHVDAMSNADLTAELTRCTDELDALNAKRDATWADELQHDTTTRRYRECKAELNRRGEIAAHALEVSSREIHGLTVPMTEQPTGHIVSLRPALVRLS